MKMLRRRLLAWLLCAAMCISLAPEWAMAEEVETELFPMAEESAETVVSAETQPAEAEESPAAEAPMETPPAETEEGPAEEAPMEIQPEAEASVEVQEQPEAPAATEPVSKDDTDLPDAPEEEAFPGESEEMPERTAEEELRPEAENTEQQAQSDATEPEETAPEAAASTDQEPPFIPEEEGKAPAENKADGEDAMLFDDQGSPDIQELRLDETISVTIENPGVSYPFSFTPDETGRYMFTFSPGESVSWVLVDDSSTEMEQGNLVKSASEASCSYSLVGGKSYSLAVWFESGNLTGSIGVTVSKEVLTTGKTKTVTIQEPGDVIEITYLPDADLIYRFRFKTPEKLSWVLTDMKNNSRMQPDNLVESDTETSCTYILDCLTNYSLVVRFASEDATGSIDITVNPEYQPHYTSGTCGDNLTWELDELGVLTISGTGPMTEEYYDDGNESTHFAPWWIYREQITTLVVEAGVTTIGRNAFLGLERLQQVSLPDGLTRIGKSAFIYCSRLPEISLPGSVNFIDEFAFNECTALSHFEIPEGVTTIESYTFGQCYNLSVLTIPDSVTSIEEAAFGQCYNLSVLTIPDSVTSIEEAAFWDCEKLMDVNISKNITYISSTAFRGCKSLARILVEEGNSAYCDIDGVLFNRDADTLLCCPEGYEGETYDVPMNTTTIGENAFCGCSGLTGISIGNGVTNIGERTFENCSSLQEITIPGSVSRFENAFTGCTALTRVVFSDGVTEINVSFDCPALNSIWIPVSVTSIGDSFGFGGDWGSFYIYYEGSKSQWDTLVANRDDFSWNSAAGAHVICMIQELPKGIVYTVVDNNRVIITGYTEELEAQEPGAPANIVIPPEIEGFPVAEIAENAFMNCDQLVGIELPPGLDRIGSGAFMGCRRLERIVIPQSLVQIEQQAFQECMELKTVHYYGSREQWSMIHVEMVDNEPLFNAVIEYNYGLPETGGVKYSFADEGIVIIGYTAELPSVLTIPATIEGQPVVRIEGYAFYECNTLTKAVIPERVTAIEESAFGRCFYLTEVSLPGGLTGIGTGAFEDCTSLTTVNYPGTEEQWNEIEIGEGNENLLRIRPQNHWTAPEATPITVNETKTIILEEAEQTRSFSFTPDQSGPYCFLPSIALVFNGIEYSLCDAKGTPISEKSSPCAYVLEAGKTCYFTVRLKEETPKTFQLELQATNRLTTGAYVSADEEPTGIEAMRVEDGAMNCSYWLHAGTTRELKVTAAAIVPEGITYRWSEEGSGNELGAQNNLTVTAGEEGETRVYLCTVADGFYGVTKTVRFTVHSIACEDIGPGSSFSVTTKRSEVPSGSVCWENYYFRPTESGIYEFTADFGGLEIDAVHAVQVSYPSLLSQGRSVVKGLYNTGSADRESMIIRDRLQGGTGYCLKIAHSAETLITFTVRAFPVNAFGDSITWSHADGTLTLSGNGETWNYPGADYGWAEYEAEIQKVVAEEGITNLHFTMDRTIHTQVSEIVLPASLESISGISGTYTRSNLTVRYAGTREQWRNVTKDRNDLSRVNILCSDGLFRILPTPEDAAWGERPGAVTFRPIDQIRRPYEVAVYKLGSDDPVNRYVWRPDTGTTENGKMIYAGLRRMAESLQSGAYYFTVRAMASENEPGVLDSEAATSELWDYAVPAQRLTTPTGVSIEGATFDAVLPEDLRHVGGYDFSLYYAADMGDELQLLNTGFAVDFPDGSDTAEALKTDVTGQMRELAERDGFFPRDTTDGYYSLRIRLLSSDMEGFLPSEWSEMSPAVFLSTSGAEPRELTLEPEGETEIRVGYGEKAALRVVATPIREGDRLSYTWTRRTGWTESGEEESLTLLSSGSSMETEAVRKPSEYVCTVSDFRGNTASVAFSVDYARPAGFAGNGITWSFGGSTLTLHGEGEVWDYYPNSGFLPPWAGAADQITVLELDEGITVLGKSAFRGLVNLERVKMPVSVTEIGNDAFSGCESLRNGRVRYGGLQEQWDRIAIGSGNGALSEAEYYIEEGSCGGSLSWILKLNGELRISGTGPMWDYGAGEAPWKAYRGLVRSGVLEDGVSSIGSGAFSDCVAMESISIPESVATLGAGAFQNCIALKTVTIPSLVTEIPESAFRRCTSLNSIVIPDQVLRLESYAFADCTAAKTVSIGTGLNEIGENAFFGCSAVQEYLVTEDNPRYYAEDSGGVLFENLDGEDNKRLLVYPAGKTESFYELPGDATEIADYAFCRCTSLQGVYVDSQVTRISANSFFECDALGYFATSWNSSETETCFWSHSGVLFGRNEEGETILVSYPKGRGETSYEVPDGVVKIGAYAFFGCTDLKAVSFPAGLTEIGEGAFRNSGLTEVVLPESVTAIGKDAFNGCGVLESITLPERISIGENAFHGCDNLKTVYYAGTTAAWESIRGSIGLEGVRLFSSDGYDDSLWVTISEPEPVIGGKVLKMESNGTVIYTLGLDRPGGKYLTYREDELEENGVLLDQAGSFIISARAVDEASGRYSAVVTMNVTLEKAEKPELVAENGNVSVRTGPGTAADAEVYYTTDMGDEPTRQAYRYTGPLELDRNIMLKAAVHEKGKAPSETVAKWFYAAEHQESLKVDTDTFGFANKSTNIGVEIYQDAFQGSVLGRFFYDNYRTQAVCFGMAATVLLFKYDILQKDEYFDMQEGNDLYSASDPKRDDTNLMKQIQKYQVAQFVLDRLPENEAPFWKAVDNGSQILNEAYLDAIAKACSGEEPIVLRLWSTSGTSHAVVPCRMEGSRVYVYDCNSPGKEQYLEFTQKDNGGYQFRYSKGAYNSALAYVPLSTLLEKLDGVQSGRVEVFSEAAEQALLALNSTLFTVLDAAGNEYSGYTAVEPPADMVTENTVIRLDRGTYTLVNRDPGLKAWTVSAAQEQEYYRVTVSDPNARIEVGEENGHLYIAVRADSLANVRINAYQAAGVESELETTAAYVKVYTGGENTMQVESSAPTMSVDGTEYALNRKSDVREIYLGTVSRDSGSGELKAYISGPRPEIRTDIAALADGPCTMTVFASDTGDTTVICAAGYDEAGKMVMYRQAETVTGKAKYVFAIPGEAAEVRVFLLNRARYVPMTDGLTIHRAE